MQSTYTTFAKSLHWLMALLITGLLALGLYMHDLPLSPQKLQLYAWHKWAGVTAFLLMWIRLAWRVMNPPPPLSDELPQAVKRLAHAGHALLYVLMIVIPVSGWLMSSAKGFQTVWFGVIPIPDLIGRDRALGDFLQLVHKGLNIALMLTLGVHVAAALWHHFGKKDDTLRRMWFNKRNAAASVLSMTIVGTGVITAPSAQAATFQSVVADKSSITFTYRQMGVAVDGKFKKFAAKVNLDTAKPAQASGQIDIDVSSIDTGSPEADEEVVSKGWFNASAYPTASFVLKQLKPVGADQYEARGVMTIKGQSVENTIPVKLTPQGVLTGTFVIRRGDFGIGQGMWAKYDVVANDITVKFTLLLK